LNVVQDYIFTEKTFSYLIDFMFHSVLGGGLTCALLEGAAKVIDAGKAAFLRDRGDGKRRVNKQLLGFADPDIQNVLSGSRVIVGLELLSQINLADTDVFGEGCIGKHGVLNMIVYVFHDETQQLRGLLFRGGKLVKQIIKSAVNFHWAFVPQKQLLQGLNTLYTALRIVQRENGYFLTIKACAGKVDHGEQTFLVTDKVVRASLGQENGIARAADILFSVHRVCDLTVHAKG